MLCARVDLQRCRPEQEVFRSTTSHPRIRHLCETRCASSWGIFQSRKMDYRTKSNLQCIFLKQEVIGLFAKHYGVPTDSVLFYPGSAWWEYVPARHNLEQRQRVMRAIEGVHEIIRDNVKVQCLGICGQRRFPCFFEKGASVCDACVYQKSLQNALN